MVMLYKLSMLPEDIVNGVDVANLPVTKDAYAYGLILLDIFSPRKNLAAHLCISPQEVTTTLDPNRVKKLLQVIQKRYKPNEHEMKTPVFKMNQKCRD